jgi:hypothetical protein
MAAVASIALAVTWEHQFWFLLACLIQKYWRLWLAGRAKLAKALMQSGVFRLEESAHMAISITQKIKVIVENFLNMEFVHER